MQKQMDPQMGTRADPAEVSANIYKWFTDGFDTADLKDRSGAIARMTSLFSKVGHGCRREFRLAAFVFQGRRCHNRYSLLQGFASEDYDGKVFPSRAGGIASRSRPMA